MKKKFLAFGIIFLFVLSTISPIVFGNNIIFNSKKHNIDRAKEAVPVDGPSDGPVSSAWPMKCHDLHHTGRSPYGTANTSYYELWSYKFDDWVDTDPSIGEDGTIYVGGSYEKVGRYLYAIYPNGTLRWRYQAGDFLWHMCPSIAEDGTIYFGAWDDCLHAVNPDGTRKWKFDANCDIVSDPTIGPDGIIYFGTLTYGGGGCRIYAINPDGTEKWSYKTGDGIGSDAAISDDGTIYIGSYDSYFYAMNPNGTLKWRYKTLDRIGGPPSIAEDGTIYTSSGGYLYALNPDGTRKWQRGGYGMSSNPSIASDGTIIIGSSGRWLKAVNPDDGSLKWEIKLPGAVRGSPAICADGIIYQGVEVGNMNGGEIVAVNPDGTLRWRSRLSNKWVDSSPCIDEEGIIYIVSSNYGNGCLHAFGCGGLVEPDTDGPYYGLIDTPVDFLGSALYGYPPYIWHWDFGDGQSSDEKNPSHVYNSPGRYTVTLTVTDQEGNISENITWATIQESNDAPKKPVISGPRSIPIGDRISYTFKSIDPEDNEVWYYIDLDDISWPKLFGCYKSSEEAVIDLVWYKDGPQMIKAKAIDGFGAESDWSEFRVWVFITRDRESFYPLIEWLLEQFPILERLLGWIR